MVLKINFNEDKPIYVQIKEYIEDSIINESIKAGERVPSTNEFAKYYKINPATAAKGINELVLDNVLVKRRGVGMFVTDHARETLIEKRKELFYKSYILPLKEEANKLQISPEQLVEMLKREEQS